ncbi:putative 2OG-Fe(II) oxygenase [Kangiella sp. HZ709]|uniref:putative 2OG-Fe(II) oxygenase n=1 Tax=Kangiella sp. HZ709 TaxID=2666328 RepID=UPI0012B00F17|nr:putative 2OG-Fe(II) oxygenase [Kangiella sp. HZ709]MRX28244.1 hypothetical protein [Kangiella sp. HZ709]
MKLEQWFALPVAVDTINKPDIFHNQLKDYILEIENSEEENKILTQSKKTGLYESEWNLLDRSEPVIRELKEEIFSRVKALVCKLNGYHEKISSSMVIKQQTWFHVTRNGGYFTNHNHPMASWSAVYCVAEGDYNSGDDSGVTRFFSPFQINGYIDAGNVNLQPPFSQSTMNIKLRTGQIIFFPSNLMHEVSPYLGAKERITIASNFWFENKYVNIRA